MHTLQLCSETGSGGAKKRTSSSDATASEKRKTAENRRLISVTLGRHYYAGLLYDFIERSAEAYFS